MNLLPLTLSGSAATMPGVHAPLTLWQPATLARHAGRTLTVGVRAEDLQLGDGPPDSGRIQATVFAVEPLGAETLLAVELPGTGLELTARLGRDVTARVGDAVTLHFPPSAVHLFDAETTAAIRKDA